MMLLNVCLIAIIVCFANGEDKSGKHSRFSPAAKLAKQLRKHYSTDVRPVNNPTDVLNIAVSAFVNNYEYCDQKKIITINTFLMESWHDENISWQPSDYDDIAIMYPRADTLWTPDFEGWTNVKPPGVAARPMRLVVQSSGNITQVEPREFTGHCEDLTATTRNCTLRIGSWVHNEYEISMSQYVSLTDEPPHPNPQWKLNSYTQKIDMKYFEGYNVGYPSLYLTFVIEKRAEN
jgi:hypothetical protein